MQPADAPHDHRPERPDHHHRPDVVAPLDAEQRYRRRRQEQHGADAEVRRIPQMPAVDPQHVLRRDRDQAGQHVRPEKRRPHQDADTDAGDVGARRMRPAAVGEPRHEQLGRDRRDDGERGSRVALEDAEREVRGDENARDEDRRDQPVRKREREAAPRHRRAPA